MSDNTRLNFTYLIQFHYFTIFVHVVYGRGSVLLRRRCETLCTCGFEDDVTYSFYDGSYGGTIVLYEGSISLRFTSLLQSWTEFNLLLLMGIILAKYVKITRKLR